MPKKILLAAFAVLFGLFALAAADMTMSVRDLMTFIQSSVKLKYPDKQVAEYLKHVELKDKLDDQTIEDLQGLGAGPKTVAALRELRDNSKSLAAPPPVVAQAAPKPIPPPSSIEQGKILDAVRAYALNYVKELPNYICVEVVRRYVDPVAADNWHLMDTMMIKLTYFDQHEDYQVEMVNNQTVTNVSLEKTGGTVSEGEFGTMMLDIFRAESEARFDWDHWGTLRGKRVYVFSFDITQSNSRYHLIAGHNEDYVPAYRGLVYADKDTNKILRIVMTPYDIPSTFPLQDAKIVLDYDYQKIGDSEFLLPLKGVVTLRDGRYHTRNDEEFRLYRKFGTETTIHFDSVPDPLPDDQVNEKK